MMNLYKQMNWRKMAIVTLLVALLLLSISLIYLWLGIGNISSSGPSGAFITWGEWI